GGGGGGGSGFATEAATNVSIIGAVNLGDGKVTVTYGGEEPPVTHTLNVTKAGTGAGIVTSSPVGIDCGSICALAYDEGTLMTLTANAASDSSFTGWSGSCSGSAACTLTMDADRAVTATFKRDSIVPPVTKPVLSMLSQTNPVFRAGPGSTSPTGTTTAVRHKQGTVFSFSLDKPATVRTILERRDRGRRVGSECRKPTQALHRRPPCIRRVRVAVLTRTSHVGRNSLAFTGRIGGVALKPGKYEAAFTAANGAGRSSAKSLRFKIVNR
ncbi:MAG: InlB B-repeat-containing protein, partial [Solirubrobacterales bacterium]